jgi:hypothetical protein
VVDALEDRQRERRRLAGPGGGLAEQVAPADEVWDRLALDRRGLLVPEGRQLGDELGPQPELRERGGRRFDAVDRSGERFCVRSAVGPTAERTQNEG